MESVNAVFLAEIEKGPWTELGETMYAMPFGSVFQSFPNTRFIKLVCLSPDKAEESATDQQTQQEPPPFPKRLKS